MNLVSEEWLDPERALTRFSNRDVSVFTGRHSEDSKTGNRFGFMLKNIGILIPEKALSEIVKKFQIFPVPNTRPWLRGLVNVRGNLIPAFDLALLLGLSEEPMGHKNLLILEKGAEALGILVDNLPRSHDISQWHALGHTPKLPGGLTDYITEVYAVNDSIWISFDHKSFFESIRERVSG